MFNELKEVKHFKEIADFKNLMLYNTLNKTFKDSSKSRSVFRT